MSKKIKIHYVSDQDFAISRAKKGKGFVYLKNDRPLQDVELLRRIESLVIPPAWVDVLICGDECGHIQAVGIDAKGRKQYIYHSTWIEEQQQHKFDHLTKFAEVLPTVRETISSDMRRINMSKERVVATVVWLLDNTFVRIGNKQYAQENKSFGLTTLREKHVEVDHDQVQFSFKGKSGVYHELTVTHPRVAKTIQKCIEIPGYELFQYLDDEKKRQVVDSRDVNEYLRSLTGEELSAKDFRTWGGTTLAATTLDTLGGAENETQFKKHVSQSIKEVAHHLRNTVTVCRKYYIHPTIIEAYSDNVLVPHFKKVLAQTKHTPFLTPEEDATWKLLRK